jgi:hypothetical protein
VVAEVARLTKTVAKVTRSTRNPIMKRAGKRARNMTMTRQEGGLLELDIWARTSRKIISTRTQAVQRLMLEQQVHNLEAQSNRHDQEQILVQLVRSQTYLSRSKRRKRQRGTHQEASMTNLVSMSTKTGHLLTQMAIYSM